MAERQRFTAKVAVVTGGARGMGATHVAALVDEGASVVATDILDEDGRALAARLGDRVHYLHHDVTQLDGWASVVAMTESTFGPIDVLVNNAGTGATGGVLEQTQQDYERVIAVNVTGPFLGMRAVVPGMVERGSGSVVNIASINGLVGRPNGLAYTTSKWALRGMTKSAALDVAHTGVRINAVHPGVIRTPMTVGWTDDDLSTQAISRLGEATEVTAMVLFLASDEASYCTGGDYPVDGGFSTGTVPARIRS